MMVSLPKIRKKLNASNVLFKTMEAPSFPVLSGYSISQASSIYSRKDRTFFISGAMRTVDLSNILVSHTSQILNVASEELRNIRKENYQLQLTYNKLTQATMLKETQLEKLQTLLDSDKLEVLEQRKLICKTKGIQDNIEEATRKFNQIELETARLEQVINCCFKNPAESDE